MEELPSTSRINEPSGRPMIGDTFAAAATSDKCISLALLICGSMLISTRPMPS